MFRVNNFKNVCFSYAMPNFDQRKKLAKNEPKRLDVLPI